MEDTKWRMYVWNSITVKGWLSFILSGQNLILAFVGIPFNNFKTD